MDKAAIPRACSSCANLHSKCDHVLPYCGRCVQLALPCTYPERGRSCKQKIRQFRGSKRLCFPKNQVWLKQDLTSITFVEVTDQGYASLPPQSPTPREGFAPSVAPPKPSKPAEPKTAEHSNAYQQCPTPIPQSLAILSRDQTSSDVASNTSQPWILIGGTTISTLFRSLAEAEERVEFLTADSNMPKGETTTQLCNHYVEKLSNWLDVCDSKKSFGNLVVERSKECQLLQWAMCAFAARHLNHHPSVPTTLALEYHGKCLFVLRNTDINSLDVVAKQDVFAATIILRVVEEIEYHDKPENPAAYLSVMQALAREFDQGLFSGLTPPLAEAAFWVGLRQDIFHSITMQQAPRLPLHHSFIVREIQRSIGDDSTKWANRCVLCCADILTICFGAQEEMTVAKKGALADLAFDCRWLARYAPKSDEEEIPRRDPGDHENGRIWTGTRYTQPAELIGTQHLLLGKFLLQRMERTKYRLFKEYPSQESFLRRICANGQLNTWCPPAIFTSCMAISLGWQLITSAQGRAVLLDILEYAHFKFGRPTASLQTMMRKAWRFEPRVSGEWEKKGRLWD